MISDDDIENDAVHEDVLSEIEDAAQAPRKSIGFKALLAGMIIAAGGGAAGGAYLSQLISPAPPPAIKTDLSTVNSSLDALARKNKALEAQLLELKKQASQKNEAKPADLSPLLSRLDALEAVAEKAPVIDEALLGRIEALQGAGSPVLDLSEITQRLDALEIAGPNQETQQKLQELSERQQALSISLDEGLAAGPQAPMSDEALDMKAATLPPFPEAEILNALSGLNKSEGWAKRTLNKHISVRGENDPESLIAAIQLDLDKGDIEAAASKFDRLPSQLRSAGQSWRAALKP